MNTRNILMAGALALATTMPAFADEVNLQLGTRELDMKDVDSKEDGDYLGAGYIFAIPQQGVDLGIGGSVTKNSVSAENGDYDYNDLSVIGTIGVPFGRLVPYGEFRYIVLSSGEYTPDSGGGDTDFDNTGYDFNVGLKYQLNRTLAISGETTLTAAQSFEGEGNNDLDYEYGLFDAFEVGVAYRL